MLQSRQREAQAAYDKLRDECYTRVKAKQTQVIPKDEFTQQLREDWNEHGGAKLHAPLKNSEKLVAVAQLMVVALERAVGGVPVPDPEVELRTLIDAQRRAPQQK